jgi:hypothetical protein
MQAVSIVERLNVGGDRLRRGPGDRHDAGGDDKLGLEG